MKKELEIIQGYIAPVDDDIQKAFDIVVKEVNELRFAIVSALPFIIGSKATGKIMREALQKTGTQS